MPEGRAGAQRLLDRGADLRPVVGDGRRSATNANVPSKLPAAADGCSSRLLDQVTRSDPMSQDQTPILAGFKRDFDQLGVGKKTADRLRHAHASRCPSVRSLWRARVQLWSLRRSGGYASAYSCVICAPWRSSQPRRLRQPARRVGRNCAGWRAGRPVPMSAATRRRSALRFRRSRCCSRQSVAAMQPSGSFGCDCTDCSRE